jgi:hypothetical protein
MSARTSYLYLIRLCDYKFGVKSKNINDKGRPHFSIRISSVQRERGGNKRRRKKIQIRHLSENE